MKLGASITWEGKNLAVVRQCKVEVAFLHLHIYGDKRIKDEWGFNFFSSTQWLNTTAKAKKLTAEPLPSVAHGKAPMAKALFAVCQNARKEDHEKEKGSGQMMEETSL